ncbi:hypothetical protein C8J57DRAFT_1520596 [Mycena rebaudengoi]|nr:hypothetical protein C8J57DRAFT_1520596 [Mycena rebaudengoi]
MHALNIPEAPITHAVDAPALTSFEETLDILREDQGNKLEKQLERTGPLFQTVMRQAYALGTPQMGCNIETTIADLVSLALELTKIENVWIEMAIAQRSNAEASIDASIRVGRKRYWRGLISDIFLGFTMRSVLEVLQKDIVNVWNMHDPEKVNPIIENPAAIVIAGPTAAFVLFAEWVRGTYKKTKSSVRCLVAFLVDLTLTTDTLFYLRTPDLQQSQGPRACQHKSMGGWMGTFGHLDADVVIKKIADIIMDNSVRPEQWAMSEEGFDELWMPIEALREP